MPDAPRPHGGVARWLPTLSALAALGLGTAACTFYASAGLQLSHYDARGHLVVARRVMDSITPGWLQIGAVWLPLPHLLNLLPVQIDALYRTGASAVAMSMLAYGVTVYALSRIILEATGSSLAAVTGTLVFATNPNVLYLQATPMTEPLLMAVGMSSLLALHAWIEHQTTVHRLLAGSLLAAACLTRYEAWPLAVAALALSACALRFRGRSVGESLGAILPIAVYPAVAVLAFLVLSRVTVGEWLVSTGFFVAENPDRGHPLDAVLSVWRGTRSLSGNGPLMLAVVGLTLLAARTLRTPGRAGALVFIATLGVAALPFYAFFQGHPFRIRYMVLLIPAVAALSGMTVGFAGRLRWIAAALLAAALAAEARPFDRLAPMVREAQLDRAGAAGRRAVTACLVRDYRGEKIMASMGSLGHYMQELSRDGFSIREFLHEGNGDIWLAALHGGPRLHVGWVLIEERAEGGDMLAVRSRTNPRFLAGFRRVCEGGGVALYRRHAAP